MGKVLIIEDAEDLRFSLAAIVRKAGEQGVDIGDLDAIDVSVLTSHEEQ